MTTRLLLVLLAATALTPRANAASCNGAAERAEMAASLRHAAEERPIHVRFATRADGVKLPATLVEKYPEEMTIILQHEFDRLVVKDSSFEVGLWFKRKYARLTVPFDAVMGLWDDAMLKCGDERR